MQQTEPGRAHDYAFLAGGGELGALIRAHDWSRTPLGDPVSWPQSLKTAVQIMLASRQPFWLGWGPELTYLYNDGADVHLMDTETFDQLALPAGSMAEELKFMRENDTVQLLLVDGSPSGVQLPAAVALEVVDTEPGVKGDTVSNVTKPATLETGAVVSVPLFVNVGERIRVDTREARYISRA